MTARWLLPLILWIVSVIAGIHFGLHSCGGHAWHKDAFFAAWGLLAIPTIALPLKPTTWSRLWPIVVAVIAFELSLAGAAPYYPAPPISLDDYISNFWLAIVRGPCG